MNYNNKKPALSVLSGKNDNFLHSKPLLRILLISIALLYSYRNIFIYWTGKSVLWRSKVLPNEP